MPVFDIKQRTFNFALETIRACKKIRKEEHEYILTKQLVRSATSVGANIENHEMQKAKQTLYIK